MTMDIAQIRRDALAAWLRGVRFPITAAEAALRRGQDTSSWPPSMAFEKVEATIKDTLGRVTGDEVLLGQATLQRAEVRKREEALVKKAQADATRQDAARKAEQKAADLERRREQVQETADEREERIEEERRQAEAQVAERAQRTKTAARKQAAARKDAVDAQATRAEATRLRKEAEALRAKEQAVAAKGDVLDLDKKVRAKKASRRAG
jgi:hypothetical protein